MEGKTINLFAIKVFLAGVLAVVLCRAEREIFYPVATVILGGLISTMVLDFTKRSTSLSPEARRVPQWSPEAHRYDEHDEDDHGLPPQNGAKANLSEIKRGPSGAVFDGGMAAAIDS